MSCEKSAERTQSTTSPYRNTITWLIGVALIGCATGLIADAFVVGELLWRPIAIGASGSAFFIGLRLWMTGIK